MIIICGLRRVPILIWIRNLILVSPVAAINSIKFHRYMTKGRQWKQSKSLYMKKYSSICSAFIKLSTSKWLPSTRSIQSVYHLSRTSSTTLTSLKKTKSYTTIKQQKQVQKFGIATDCHKKKQVSSFSTEQRKFSFN